MQILRFWQIIMKSSTDPRHLKRREYIKQLFAEGFTHQPNLNDTVKMIQKDKNNLDELIKKAAPDWPIDKLNKIDLSILRLAIHELHKGETPPKVIIDEAVELAKEYGSENSSSFVNGVLGTIYKDIENNNTGGLKPTESLPKEKIN